MTDSGFKKLLGFLLQNKKTAFSLLENFTPTDIERGIISISEPMLNRDIKMLVMDKISTYIEDYHIGFQQDSIFLDLDIHTKPLGRLKAKYMLKIIDFSFHNQNRNITFQYWEDVKSEGNFVQNMAVKAAGMKGSYLQTGVEMAHLDFIFAEKDRFTVVISNIKGNERIPDRLQLEYISSQDGILKLKFYLES